MWAISNLRLQKIIIGHTYTTLQYIWIDYLFGTMFPGYIWRSIILKYDSTTAEGIYI